MFLPVFPLWAIVIGQGMAWLWDLRDRRWPRVGLALLFLVQGYGLCAMHPFGLSYHNALVGGLRGAERLGLELTFWSDAIDGVLLDDLAARAAPGDLAAVVPTLHHIQPASMMTPTLLERRVRLETQEERGRARWWVVSRRTAYWPDGLAEALRHNPPVSVRSRQGVWLSGTWRVSETN